MAESILIFLVGFLFGRIYNFFYLIRDHNKHFEETRKELELERRVMRSNMEDEILIELGMGDCHGIADAKEHIGDLKRQVSSLHSQ